MNAKITRLPDWIALLNAHVVANMETTFEWGVMDCALWAASCLEVQDGTTQWGDPYRGKYKTAAGAVKTLWRVSRVKTPDERARQLFGDPKPIAFAAIGDMVAADLDRLGLANPAEARLGLSLGMCLGRSSFFISSTGLVALPTLSLEHCYHG